MLISDKKKLPDNIPKPVMDTINTNELVCPSDSVLVAVSGGADSVALVHMLAGIGNTFGLKLGVAHLNHELRGSESDEDQMFVERLAENMGLPFYTERVNVKAYQKTHGLSLEEAARNVRYAFLLKRRTVMVTEKSPQPTTRMTMPNFS